MDHEALTEMCSKACVDVIFRACGWNSNATDPTEGEKSVTICEAAPTVGGGDGGEPNTVAAVCQIPAAVSATRILWNLYKNKHGHRELRAEPFSCKVFFVWTSG